MLLKRWITAVVLLPFLIALIYKGSPFHFSVFIAASCLVALWEYFKIALPECGKTDPHHLLAYAVAPAIIGLAHAGMFDIGILLLGANLMISALMAIIRFKDHQGAAKIVAFQMFGLIYVVLFLTAVALIRMGDNGVTWIFLLGATVFSGDTGAYYAGTYFGKNPLAPAVSPKKTIEGALGGLSSTVCAGSLITFFFLPNLSWSVAIPMFLAIGFFAQAGDLFESILKRTSGIKDSGVILPGHGGVLDRIDGVLFAAPVVYFFQTYLAGG